jgi:hypothetical protein
MQKNYTETNSRKEPTGTKLTPKECRIIEEAFPKLMSQGEIERIITYLAETCDQSISTLLPVLDTSIKELDYTMFERAVNEYDEKERRSAEAIDDLRSLVLRLKQLISAQKSAGKPVVDLLFKNPPPIETPAVSDEITLLLSKLSEFGPVVTNIISKALKLVEENNNDLTILSKTVSNLIENHSHLKKPLTDFLSEVEKIYAESRGRLSIYGQR